MLMPRTGISLLQHSHAYLTSIIYLINTANIPRRIMLTPRHDGGGGGGGGAIVSSVARYGALRRRNQALDQIDLGLTVGRAIGP